MIAPAAIVTAFTSSAVGDLKEPSGSSERAEVRSLTSRLASGDEDAFREFHAAYFDRLLRYLIVVTRGDEDAAREALQETFTRVVRYARRFDSEETFWCWLTVLARSAASDAGRRQRRYWRLIANYAVAWMTPAPARASDPEADERLRALLEDGLMGLDTVDRALVEGKYLQRASVRELAAQFRLSDRAVESRLLRARRQLRKNLLKRLKDEEPI